MKRKTIIRLTESDLHRIVEESVKKVLKEGKKDRMPWSDALEACLRGESVPANGDEGLEIFLRHCAWDRGLELVNSGIEPYKSFRFEKPKF